MARCASCGEENPDEARFCLACGAALADGPAVRRSRKTVTVLFGDLSGFTSLGERLDPEALRSLMEEYYALSREVLQRHGGAVEKFIGDAVMAAFGATETHEDDALRAVRAALELRDRLAVAAADLPDAKQDLAVRIGVSTGEVIVGDPATGEAFATGDAVNVAARLEQAAAPGEILISDATRRLVEDAVATEPLAPLELRGKREAVRAHRLLEVIAGAPGRTRRLDLPLVGRTRERRLLDETFDRAVADRSPYRLTILGPAGVGKSRLVHEFVVAARARGNVLRGRCLPYGDGITYWPIAEIVREAAAIRATDRHGTALKRLDALLTPEGAEAPLIRGLLAGAIGLGPSSGTPEETAWAVRRLLIRLTAVRPLVLVIDDIQWGEAALFDLLEGLLDWIREVPLFIICLARPELLESRPTWGGGKLNAGSLLLEPLSAEECGTLTGELLGGGTVPAEVTRRVGAVSEGNPLFVEEFVTMLLDEGRLRREGDRWSTVGSLDDLAVPPTVSALLAARLDRLAEGERRVLEVASVQGKSFSRLALERLSGMSDQAILGARLQSLVRQELLRPDGLGPAGGEAFRFRHILLRDAAYARLTKADRGDLHERFAGWLTEAAGDRLEEYEEIVGYHLEQAWRYRRELRPRDPALPELATLAATRLAAAGRRALGRGDLVAALSLLSRAVDLEPNDPDLLARLLVHLGSTYGEHGDLDSALATLARARATAEEAGLAAPAALAAVETARVGLNAAPVGWAQEATGIAQEALRAFEAAGDDEGQARAWHLIGMVDVMRTRAQGMLEAHARAREHALRAGDARLASDSEIWVAIALLMGPTPAGEALARCDQLLAAPDLHARTEAGLRAARAGLLAMVGDVVACRSDIARAREITAMLGPSVVGAAYTQLYGMAEVLAGDVATSAGYLREGLEMLEGMGELGFRSTSAGLLGYVLFDLGDAPGAAAYAERCRDLAAPDDVFSQMLWRLGLARPWALSGRMAEALRLLDEAVEIATTSDFPWVRGSAIMNRGSLLVLAGQREAGEAAIRQALALYEQKGVAPSIAVARAQMAALESRPA